VPEKILRRLPFECRSPIPTSGNVLDAALPFHPSCCIASITGFPFPETEEFANEFATVHLGCTIDLSDKRTAVRTEVAAAQRSAFSPYTADDAWLSDAPTCSSARIPVIAIYNNAAERCAVHGTKKESSAQAK